MTFVTYSTHRAWRGIHRGIGFIGEVFGQDTTIHFAFLKVGQELNCTTLYTLIMGHYRVACLQLLLLTLVRRSFEKQVNIRVNLSC